MRTPNPFARALHECYRERLDLVRWHRICYRAAVCVRKSDYILRDDSAESRAYHKRKFLLNLKEARHIRERILCNCLLP